MKKCGMSFTPVIEIIYFQKIYSNLSKVPVLLVLFVSKTILLNYFTLIKLRRLCNEHVYKLSHSFTELKTTVKMSGI